MKNELRTSDNDYSQRHNLSDPASQTRVEQSSLRHCLPFPMWLAASVATCLFVASGMFAQAPMNTSNAGMQHPDWVQAPGELIRPDCVHEIPNGATVEFGADGQPTGDVTLNGKLIAHYDACPEAPVITRRQGSTTDTNRPPSINGWVEASQWDVSLSPSDNIDLMNGYWLVPSPPSVNGALIYLFNGILDSSWNWILQPVLQYGVSPAGGGNYWGIASWFVGSNGYALHSPLERVNSGDILAGYTEITSVSGGILHWIVHAYDNRTGASSWITASTSRLHWTWAFAGVLEAYGVNACSQLPASGYAQFFYDSVYHGFPHYNYVSPPGWYGAMYGTGGLPCYFGVEDISGYSILYFWYQN